MEPSSSPTLTTLTVPSRFAGPPASANGGYVCGRLAAHVPTHGAVVVTLRTPPPLETRMTVTREGEGARLLDGDRLVADAAPTELDVDVVEPVGFAEAEALGSRFGGLDDHPFPTCFVCGPDREPGDGMRLFPGRVEGRPDTVAAAWVPDASLTHSGGTDVPEEFVWAALDCPSGWAVNLAGRPMVLGRMTCQVDEIPAVGERCVVMGRVLGQEGRKAFTTTSAYDADGRVLGRAHAVWIAVDPAAMG